MGLCVCVCVCRLLEQFEAVENGLVMDYESSQPPPSLPSLPILPSLPPLPKLLPLIKKPPTVPLPPPLQVVPTGSFNLS